jgi:1-acyl-sn-glycerol-3-phosphate acyltransferase
MKKLLFNAVFYPVFLAFSLTATLIAGPPALILYPWKPRLVERWTRRFIWIYGCILSRGILPLFVSCRFDNENDRPFSRASIYVANHNSSSDAFLLGLLPRMEAVMFVQSWAFRFPLIGFFARHAGYFDIKALPAEQQIHRAVDLLSRGISLIVFPEGTRSGTAPMGRFHSLPFKIALESGAELVPLVLTGNRRFPEKGSLILHPEPVRLTALEIIETSRCRDINAFALKNRVRERIRRKKRELEGEIPPPLAGPKDVPGLMPHEPPMLLVDRLVEGNGDYAVAETEIRPGLFTDESGRLDECVYPELMAQTAALNQGYRRRSGSAENENARGFVVSFKNVRILRFARCYDPLSIRIENRGSFENLNVIHGEIRCRNHTVATGEVRIWAP